MPQTIWYISKYVTPPQYGSATRGFLLAREFVRSGYPTVIVSSDANHLGIVPGRARAYTRECLDGVEIWWIQTLKYVRTASLRRVLSWLHFELRLFWMPTDQIARPDTIIVSSLSLLTILNGYRLKRRFKCRLVFEVRDIWPLTMTEEGRFRKSHPLVRILAWIERFGYLKADLIIGTMPNLKTHVEKVLGTKKPCYCVPIGFEPDRLEQHSVPDGFEERYIKKEKFTIGYSGSIGLTNALDSFLACAKNLSRDETIHFLLVGDGDLRSRYEAMCTGQSNITFAPKVAKEHVIGILERCDVLYLATHDSEVWEYGQSLNKLIDYMLAGRPIIASYGGFRSMIDEAQCGIFIPTNDSGALASAIFELALLPSRELQEMGKRGRDWLTRERSYDVLSKQYLALLDAAPAPPTGRERSFSFQIK